MNKEQIKNNQADNKRIMISGLEINKQNKMLAGWHSKADLAAASEYRSRFMAI